MLLKINSNISNENEELKKRIRGLELRSLASNLREEYQSLKENINLLEKRLSEAKTFLNLEKINRKIEKRKLIEDNEILSNKTLGFEQKVKYLEENKKSLDLTCSKLNGRNNQLIKSKNLRRITRRILTPYPR